MPEQFVKHHPDIRVRCILADALCGNANFVDKASEICGGVQVISKIKNNQNILFRNKKQSAEKYFKKHPGVPYKVKIRGGKEITVIVNSARLYLCAHGKKRFIIAIKYEGEKEYRYIIASDMSRRTPDIVQAFTLRRLVGVFLQDWKSYEGWGQLTRQTGEDGSRRSLILSLLTDLCLFFHPDRTALPENKLSAYAVGSLRDKIRAESLVNFISEDIPGSDDPVREIRLLSKTLEADVYKLAPSTKHMADRDLGRLDPTLALKYRTAA